MKQPDKCARKVRYRNEAKAKVTVRQMKKKSIDYCERLAAYGCDYCGGWHIGNSQMPLKLI